MCWQVVSILTFSPTSASMNAFRLFLLKSAPLIEIVCSFQIQFVQEWSLIKCDTKSKHCFLSTFWSWNTKNHYCSHYPGHRMIIWWKREGKYMISSCQITIQISTLDCKILSKIKEEEPLKMNTWRPKVEGILRKDLTSVNGSFHNSAIYRGLHSL